MRDPLHTRLCDEYGCEYPIVAFSHTKDVVAAVTNAGGIGIYGATNITPEALRSDLHWIMDRIGGKLFGVDLILPATFIEGSDEDLEAQVPQGHRDFIEGLQREQHIPDPKTPGPWFNRANLLQKQRAKLEICLELNVPIFASGLGSPAFIVEQAHARGIKVWGLVGLARQAKREIEAGVDLIIAQGTDAGGHTGNIGTFSLVPAVVEVAGDTPVLAAGGVTTGAHLVAALALGAVGVWTGTIWQATHESDLGMPLKQQILDARTEDAVLSKAGTGKSARVLRNRWTQAWEQEGAPKPLGMPLQQLLVAKFRQAVADWDFADWEIIAAGQGSGRIHELKPARQVVFDLMEEARDVIDAMTGESVESSPP